VTRRRSRRLARVPPRRASRLGLNLAQLTDLQGGANGTIELAQDTEKRCTMMRPFLDGDGVVGLGAAENCKPITEAGLHRCAWWHHSGNQRQQIVLGRTNGAGRAEHCPPLRQQRARAERLLLGDGLVRGMHTDMRRAPLGAVPSDMQARRETGC
jgi:hypothetical protein